MKTRDYLPIADDFDGRDLKGWVVGWLYPIAEVLYVAGESIPDEWEFSAPMLRPDGDLGAYLEFHENWQTNMIVEEYRRNGADGLLYVARVLDRYFEMFVRGTDHDY
jgi:hypothetical protein